MDLGGGRQSENRCRKRGDDRRGDRLTMRAWVAVMSLVSLAGCGYHVGGQANLLPKEIHTIAVPQFGNVTVQYKLAGMMAEAVTRELISRTHYTIVADPTKADATLYGSVVNMFSNATLSDPVTGRGASAQVTVQVQMKLVAKDGKVLFTRPNFQFLDRYEISVIPNQYIDESQATLQRLSRDVARGMVSAILENF
jgi:outer membrane lipopolysaccharide assembly protein LptE/RlpB